MIDSLRRLTFRQRQSLTLLALAILPLAVALALAIPASQSFIIRQTTAQLDTVADFKIAQIRQWLDQGRDAAVLVANLHILTDDQFTSMVLDNGNEQVKAGLVDVLQTIVSVNQHVQAISMLHPTDGRVMLSTDPTQLGREHGHEASFQQGQQALFISPVSYSVGREAPLLMISTPVHSHNGALLAVAVIEMNLTNLQIALNSRTGLGQTGRAYLIEANNFYATLPRDTEAGLLGTTVQSEGIDLVLAGNSGSAIYPDPSGISVLGVYRWLPEIELGLLVEIEEVELTREVRQIWLIAIGVSAGIFVLAALSVRTMVNWLMAPLERIAAAAHGLQAGKLDRRVPEGGPDEIGQLATAFNAMADSVQESYQELEAKVARRTAELAQANEQLREEITERTRAEAELKVYSERLQEMVDERTAELQEMHEELIRRERLAVLGQLSGGIAHELRNPLGAIRNAAYYLGLALDQRDEKIQEVLDILEREVDTCERIISSLLDFARSRTPKRREVDVNDVLKEAVVRANVPSQVEVVSQLDQSLPPVAVDPDQLIQVFSNLIINAAQAMPEGGQVTINSQSNCEEWVDISFADTGVGIPENHLQRLFEPLFTTKAKGIGLGLALVKILVEGHGGTVDAESKLGAGSIFTVHLPLDHRAFPTELPPARDSEREDN